MLAIFNLLWACSTPSTENNVIQTTPGIDQVITENVDYSAIGKTKLSEYGFFKGRLADLIPQDKLLPYELNSPLFSDYASKKRFIYLPEGKQIEHLENEVLQFPIGTILIKNFYYSSTQLKSNTSRIIETRLLIHEANGWKALPYIWNEEQDEAYLEITGGSLSVELLNKDTFEYAIPDMTQCKSCHDKAGQLKPIGPTLAQLNRVNYYPQGDMNQLQKLESIQWIDELPNHIPTMPSWDDPLTGTLNEKARAYLDINCAHCHNPMGPAKNSGLDLSYQQSDPYKFGVLKKPVAAGRGSADLKFGIAPGHPEASILLHRMQSTDPGTMMPELGRSLTHAEGITLIREWIEKM